MANDELGASREAETKHCYWTQDDLGGDSVWETSCRHAFEFTDGGPLANGFQWCGYCGRPLVETLTSLTPEVAEASARPAPLPLTCCHGHTTRKVGCVSCVLVFDRPADRAAPPPSTTPQKED